MAAQLGSKCMFGTNLYLPVTPRIVKYKPKVNCDGLIFVQHNAAKYFKTPTGPINHSMIVGYEGTTQLSSYEPLFPSRKKKKSVL